MISTSRVSLSGSAPVLALVLVLVFFVVLSSASSPEASLSHAPTKETATLPGRFALPDLR
ncbi:hypothetical protein GCM10023235_00660 [Kitasatospora terrestris]|uniref:Secreted protein n=1 Tax=Kitasatospora terrestris TaxID=258051 RepID=A0ABP9D9I2_9ACTN